PGPMVVRGQPRVRVGECQGPFLKGSHKAPLLFFFLPFTFFETPNEVVQHQYYLRQSENLIGIFLEQTVTQRTLFRQHGGFRIHMHLSAYDNVHINTPIIARVDKTFEAADKG
ncbi:MAG: hypothetical protein PWP37_120, partial [Thermotogota bacterium]|nr:hypothetical protein [Thermotogota bacterium]MDK2863928.1 hypothetical protein [Thermotogota bacterium]